MEWLLAARILLGAVMLLALWMVIGGLMDMQRINTQDPEVLELLGTVRRLDGNGRTAALTVISEDEVLHVSCKLPGRYMVTDLVPLLWRRGSLEAVAVKTITRGQRRFLLGILLLAGAAAALMML